MNCDQVFDILTRGPFPAGEAHDAAVERHLAGCHECRSLAEALRPAVDLLHETLAADEEWELPGYRGVLAQWETSAAGTATLAAIERESRAAPPSRSTVRAWQFAAALLLGVVLGAGIWSSGLFPRNAADPLAESTAVVPAALIYEPDEPGRQLLGSLDLPTACSSKNAPSLSVAERNESRKSDVNAGSQGQACCTFCHHAAGSAQPQIGDMAVLARSCKACHPL